MSPNLQVAPLVVMGALVASLLPGCSACEGSKAPRPGASAAEPAQHAPSASVSEAPPPPPERRSLPERGRLDPALVLKARSDVLTRLKDARALASKADGVAALVALQQLDPVGGVVAVSLAQAALAAADFPLAARTARIAATAGIGRSALVGDAERVLGEALERLERPGEAIAAYEATLVARRDDAVARSALERLRKAGPAPTGAPSAPRVRSIDEACAAVEREVRSGKIPLAFSTGSDAKTVGCVAEATLEVEAPSIQRVHALRVDVAGVPGADRLIWVAIEAPSGVDVFGPVAAVFRQATDGPVNDVLVDLQKIDVLPGGAPEIVAKILERRTLPDVALNEVVEIDVTRAVLLTADRGGIQPSREVTLSSRQHRGRLDAKSVRMPQGFSSGPAGGRTLDYVMKVAWQGPNGMTLTKVSGNAEPPLSGGITLFP